MMLRQVQNIAEIGPKRIVATLDSAPRFHPPGDRPKTFPLAKRLSSQSDKPGIRTDSVIERRSPDVFVIKSILQFLVASWAGDLSEAEQWVC